MSRTALAARPRSLRALGAAATLAVLLTACGSGSDPRQEESGAGAADGTGINTSPQQDRIRGKKDAEAAGLVPAKIRERGTLRIGGSADAAPPLGFYATDDKTRIGVETDLAVLVADTLGLKPQFEEVSWENLFVGLDSGKFDAVFSNVTVTEERKEKYDFATYRLDDIAFEAKRQRLEGEEAAGGADIQGKIAATTKKDSGLVDAYAAALDQAIADGTYAEVLKRWNLSGEAVEKSEINPPGLPKP